MKNKKIFFRYIFIILLILWVYNINYITASAASSCSSEYKYTWICTNSGCTETKDSFSTNEYMLSNYSKIFVDFNKKINTELYNNENTFKDINFYIDWYCNNWDCNDLIRKTFTIESILDENNSFKVKTDYTRTYPNWYSYIIANYSSTLNDLHKSLFWYYPSSDKYSLRKIFFWNANVLNTLIFNREHIYFNVSNICDNNSCDNSRIKNIYLNWDREYPVLAWTSKRQISNQDIADFRNPKLNLPAFKLDRTIQKVWLDVKVSFWFSDLLPISTTCWSERKYKYQIYWYVEWETNPSIQLTQEFEIDYITGKLIKRTDWTWVWDWIVFTKEIWDSVFVDVSEPISLAKTWEIKFKIIITDINNSYTIEQDIFNTIDVLAWDPDITKSTISMSWFDVSKNYYPGDTFNFDIILKDSAWNKIKDTRNWLDIEYVLPNNYKISNSSSEFIPWPLYRLKSNNSAIFSFRNSFDMAWFYDKIFKITYYKIDTNWNLTGEKDIFNLKVDDIKIHVKKIWVTTDFNLICTNKNIKLSTKCVSDNFSWCNHNWNQSQIFTSNVWRWWLIIKDYANNQKSYSYDINHIDKTAPSIIISWTYNLWNTYNIKARDDIYINISDTTADYCKLDNYLYIKIIDKNTWKIIYKYQTSTWNLSVSLRLAVLEGSWLKNLDITVSDKYWNINNKNITFNVFPSDLDESKTTISVSSNKDKFANNSDSYNYILNLKDKYWNPIYNKDIDFINQDCSNLTWCKTIKTNMDLWDDALIEQWYWTSDLNWIVSFSLKSLSPWDFFQSFKIRLNKWDDSYSDISWNQEIIKNIADLNSFKKPVTSVFELSNDWINWWAKPEVWKDQKYRIRLNNVWWLSPSSTKKVFWHNIVNPAYYSNWDLNLQKSAFTVVWWDWLKFTNINSYFWSNLSTNIWFDWKFDLDNDLLSATNIKADKFLIKYKIWWKNISYYLDWSSITWCSKSTLWVKVEWILQWNWKSDLTWQKSNFSDLSKVELRTSIRKNAYLLTKWMTSLQILNWVKYVEWDTTISWNDLWYETLVVKNGNVIISWDLNTSKKKLWIIVLKDNYNASSDYDQKWNIYVANTVANINAIIYADWTFRSAKVNWAFYNDSELSNRLDLYGSLFTRNTIWWAVKAWSNYTLPGWSVTTNQSLAENYDLNYVRKTSICGINDYSFKITYNPTIQTNPLKWFTK